MLKSTRERVSAIPAWATQQCPIAAANELHAVAGKTDGDLPDRVADPGCCINLVLGEEMLGYGAVDGAARARVDGAQHLAGALTSLWRQAWIGRHALAEHSVPEAFNRGQPVGCQFIEHDERAKGAGIIDADQGDVVGLAAQYEPDQTRIMLDDGVGVKILNAEAEMSRRVRSDGERKCRGIGLRGPEDRLD